MNHRSGITTLAPLGLACLLASWTPAFAADNAGQLDFFESRIRPVLAEKCYQCHSVDAEKLKGGLLVDSRNSLLNGGDTDAAIEPGDADASLMIEALRYGDPDFQMPPKGKLADSVIADFEKWVAMGAPWPDEPEPVRADGGAVVEVFDLDKRRTGHWAWQPIEKPAAPAVTNAGWSADPLDRFVLARLEAAGLAPAADTAPATWLRRVSFDLVGLPPSVEELAEFETAHAADPDAARAAVADRLLASPRFGERWARHWMDLVRYGETCGHEFDYPIPQAHKYRDYLIRAFNTDLPFDDFVREHVAGDQLAEPRRHPDTATNESILGTGFWFLNESVHAPTDVRQWEADHIDNRIDALSRGFLGLTVACARCHDHKFDAIPTTDYYALAGYLQSSRRADTPLDPGQRIATAIEGLEELHARGNEILRRQHGSQTPAPAVSELRDGETVFATFDQGLEPDWQADGTAFTNAAAHCRGGEWTPGDPTALIAAPGILHSGSLAARAEGALRSPTFELSEANVHLRLKGASGGLVVRLVIDGYDMNSVHTLLFKGSILKDKALDTGGEYQWLTMRGNLDKYVGHRVYFEILDQGDGWIALDEIRLSSHADPPKAAPPAESLLGPYNNNSEFSAIAGEFEARAAALPKPEYAIAMIDGTPENEHVFIRGSHKSPGELVPRRFLAALGGENHAAPADRSGRLQLAGQMLADDNPLTARVIVNRLWHHLFGRGIVPTVDDFGVMGQPPSHPELLDHLAGEFRTTHRWSIKSALRTIVLSRAYRMSSTPHPDNDPDRLAEIDPDNVLLHRAPVRRLQAEAIRDAILAVSGKLDRSLGGASVPVHLTGFMEGRGRPKQSGPLDGDGRRSVYLEVRRNFLNPMMLAFDMPSPFSAMGRRSVSNVPSQSLVLMNDPFVIEQAGIWAESLADRGSDRERLVLAFRQAFSRAPEDTELEPLLDYLAAAGDREAAWRDLCHVLFNKKEFIYLQ